MRVFGCHTDQFLMLQKLPCRFRSAHAHTAFSISQIQHLIHVGGLPPEWYLLPTIPISAAPYSTYVGTSGPFARKNFSFSSSFTKISFLVSGSFISSQVMPICSKSSMVFFARRPFPRAKVRYLIFSPLPVSQSLSGSLPQNVHPYSNKAWTHPVSSHKSR